MFKTWQNKTSNHLGTETGQNPTEINRNMFLCFAFSFLKNYTSVDPKYEIKDFKGVNVVWT